MTSHCRICEILELVSSLTISWAGGNRSSLLQRWENERDFDGLQFTFKIIEMKDIFIKCIVNATFPMQLCSLQCAENIPHPSSSEPSAQSFRPSQCLCGDRQAESEWQTNSPGTHSIERERGGKTLCWLLFSQRSQQHTKRSLSLQRGVWTYFILPGLNNVWLAI